MTRVLLFCRGEMPSWRSPPLGELLTVVVVVLQREQYHVVAAVEGHELETPKAEHRPRLKRLLKSTHLELNGKVFVNTQQAPTWRANCRGFGPGESLDQRVNLSLRVPAQMGWCEMEHKGGGMSLVLSCTRVLVVGVTSIARGREREGEYERARERERERERVWPCSSSPVPLPCVRVFVRSYVRPPFSLPLDIPFYRHKEMAQLYNGGVAMRYVACGEVPGRHARVDVSVGEVHVPCRSTAVGAAWILLTSPCFRRGLENHRRHGRTRGTIIAYYLGKLDGTLVLFLRSLS
jgi:hypothetical protein